MFHSFDFHCSLVSRFTWVDGWSQCKKSHKEERKEHINPPARPPHSLHQGEPMTGLLPSCLCEFPVSWQSLETSLVTGQVDLLIDLLFPFQLQLHLTFRVAHSLVCLANSSDSSISWQTGVILSNSVLVCRAWEMVCFELDE